MSRPRKKTTKKAPSRGVRSQSQTTKKSPTCATAARPRRRDKAPVVQDISIDQIRVINPRARDQVKFGDIVENLETIGLKRPILVAPRKNGDGKTFDLICGQGRLEGYQALGQSTVPAIVSERDRIECYLMSLVENIARPLKRGSSLFAEIGALHKRGCSTEEIGKRIGFTPRWVRSILPLLEHGEPSLLTAVESRKLPIHIAVAIASSNDKQIEEALTEAYESGALKGKAFLHAKRLAERRRGSGKNSGKPRRLTARDLVEAVKRESARQAQMVKKAELFDTRMAVIVNSLRQLVRDTKFRETLEQEGLTAMPQVLRLRVFGETS